jgi:two-component system, NarL family, response regulator LiaR
MSEEIRILIAEDHKIVREGLCALLTACPDMQVVGEATNGAEAVEKVAVLQPDVILMDLIMPIMDGLQAIQSIRSKFPDARILVLTSFGQDQKVYQAIKAGALGYLLKDSTSQELIQAIRDVFNGRLFLQPAIALRVARELNRQSSGPSSALTEREIEVLKLIAQGFSNREIAAQLSLSGVTVDAHASSILSKLHLSNRTQAALYAIRSGLVDIDFDESSLSK